jgi:phage repressor protein C with HTH and peptisase S24 domain
MPLPRWKEPDPSQFDFVPMVEAHISATGENFLMAGNARDYYAFRKEWLRKMVSDIGQVVLMAVRGPSMIPTIVEGDVVMIDEGRRRIHNGCIYALGIEETITIKRLEILPNRRARVVSDNRAEYPPYETALESIRILGQVIWYARTLTNEGG